MVVISDSTAITNLYQIKLLMVVKQLYGEIFIPEGVYQELSNFSDQKALIDQSDWIKICKIKDQNLLNDLLEELDRGEAEAILLAIESQSDLLIIDERKGRQVAKQHGLRLIGILGVLINAKEKGIIPAVKSYMDELVGKAGFYVSKELYEDVLRRVGER